MIETINERIRDLQKGNQEFIRKEKNLNKHVKGQNPKICVLTCSDSRVIPEFIFNKNIGELFVVRVAGNVAIDESVITSLEYAVSHLQIFLLLILGHTNCGAIKAAEEADEVNGLLKEIKDSFKSDNHGLDNLKYQLKMLPKRSMLIKNAIKEKKIDFVGAIYNIENGKVDFLL